MTPHEADDLAARITHTWHTNRIPADEWAEVLTPLDAGTAGTAYVRLRNDSDNPPSIARFLATYRSLNTRRLDDQRGDCDHCDGTGWDPVIFTATDDHTFPGHTYNAVRPCPCCRTGELRRTLHRQLTKETA